MVFRNLLDRLTFIRPSFRSEDQPHLSPGHPSLAQTSAQKPSEVFVEDPGLSTSVVKIYGVIVHSTSTMRDLGRCSKVDCKLFNIYNLPITSKMIHQ